MNSIFETEETRAIREMARKFATERIAPGYREREKTRTLNPELIEEMGALGLIAPELPEEAGGMGASYLYSGIIIEEIARADFNFGYVPLLASLNGQIVSKFAKPEIAQQYLTRLTAGKIMIAIALTEPRGGSDAANLALRMEKDGDYYILNGEKTGISAARQAEALVVFGRTGTVEDKAKGVSAILVPTNTPGVTTSEYHGMGQHCIGWGSVFFDNVRIHKDYLLGDENKGFVQVMQGFDFSRSLIGMQCLGVAKQSLEETWAYVAERRAFGKPLAAFQGVTHQLATFDTKIEAARLLSMHALWLKDQGLPHTAEAAMTKWWPPLLAYEAIHCCLLMFGHAGYSVELPYEQRLRDVLGLQIGDGAANIMKNIIARERAGRIASGT